MEFRSGEGLSGQVSIRHPSLLFLSGRNSTNRETPFDEISYVGQSNLALILRVNSSEGNKVSCRRVVPQTLQDLLSRFFVTLHFLSLSLSLEKLISKPCGVQNILPSSSSDY